MNIEQISARAIARAEARHAASGADMLAGFVWSGDRYEIIVCGYVVAALRTIAEVRKFSEMHNTTRTA